MTVRRSTALAALSFASALTIAACATPVERPDRKLAEAEEAVRDAEATEAREHEPVLLNQAQNKVLDARELINQEEYATAERLLEQALAEAQLAGARSESARMQKAVDELNESIESMQQEIGEEQ
ncbi:DUF4398 domain-containing protein [Aquisalimonas sp.]|uniref:DUF4398 domain-containing protein n=1 Tax=Aquisalimonas sp. TaxID=1872621 RepID=UPI0025B94C34|nr:DUF4398 domain-containing protein [Aquisalimonas sp.]